MTTSPAARLAGVKVAFGLAFDVEKSSLTKSGFKPADVDLGAGLELFGTERLEGFAAIMRLGAAEEIIIVGGDEGRYKGEVPTINRAETIRKMMIEDCGIDAARVGAFASRSNTGGNVQIIAHIVRERNLAFDDFAVITSHYHVPRADDDLKAAGIFCKTFSAESFTILLEPARKNALIEAYSHGLAERMLEEIQGRAHKINATYKARTDAPATVFDPQRQKV